jgi:hypothetical protein
MHVARFLSLGLLLTALEAAVPPAPRIFPQDTLMVATVPDWTAAESGLRAAPFGQMWADPAMRPFREKAEQQIREKLLGSMEKDLGIKTQDFLALLQGQVSFAALRGDWKPSEPTSNPTFVLLIDAKDKSDQLKTLLQSIRQKISELKKTAKTSKIRDLEFTTLVIETPADAQGDGKKEDDEKTDAKADPLQLTFGQVDSALVVATSTAGLEPVIARLTGGTVAVLADNADFSATESWGGFREASAYAYLQTTALLEIMKSGDSKDSGEGLFGLNPEQAITGMGLDGIRSAAWMYRNNPNGMSSRTLFTVPESKRVGLAKLMRFEAKESAPPAFVPADAVSFQRMRVNGQQLWSGLESMVQKMSPQLGGLLSMSLGALGKDKDPKFDFRQMFFGNLGDDYVSFEKVPRSRSAADLANPPSLTLVGAVRPDDVIMAIKALSGLLPGGGDDLKEREVNGKKIWSMTLPNAEGGARVLEIASTPGYVAFANDKAILEEYLRSAEAAPKPLKDQPGLAEAAQQVGGFSKGVFGYDNQRESAQTTWETLRSGSGIDGLVPTMGKEAANNADDWVDFKLLPPFDQVSKYFGISVSTAYWDGTGFQMQSFYTYSQPK